jgi:hypothetical protein
VRVDYGPGSREWLRDLVEDLSDDGLVDVERDAADGETVRVRLPT